MFNLVSCVSTPDSSFEFRKASQVTHHVYPSYNDINNSNNNNRNAQQTSVNSFLTRENYDNDYLKSFPYSPMPIAPLATPSSAVPAIHTQDNYNSQAPATQFQRFSTDEMIISASVSQQQQYYHSHHNQHQQFIPYNINSDDSPSTFLCMPPISANSSSPPTSTDPSATFQFELNSSRCQKNVSHKPLQSTNNIFVSNSHNQQQKQQNNGFI